MQAIIFALLSYIGWGTGDVYATQAARRIGPYSATFWYLFLQLIIYLPLGLFFLDDLSKITFGLTALTLGLAIIGDIGLITFYQGVRIGNPALVGTISSSFIALTIILSIIFFKESLTLNQTLGIVIIFLGLIISGLNIKELKQGLSMNNKGILLALVSMITWGIYWTFIKIPVVNISWFWTSIIALSSFPFVYLFMLFAKIKLKPVNHQKAFVPLLLNAALIGFGSFTYYYAISRGLISIVAPIAGSYPTLFAVLAHFIFKDPITKQQILGIATTLLGIVLLSVFSV